MRRKYHLTISSAQGLQVILKSFPAPSILRCSHYPFHTTRPYSGLDANRGISKFIPDKITIDTDVPPYAKPGTGWYTGGTAPAAAGASGAVRWFVKKQVPVHAGTNAPTPHMGVAFIPNQRGLSAFIHQLPRAHGDTKIYKNVHPTNE